MSSFRWSIVPLLTPLVYYRSLRPPDWESGNRGSHNTAPEAAASFDTGTWGLRSRCGSPQVPFLHLSAPSVTWRQSYEIIGSSLEKRMRFFFFSFVLIFFPVTEPWKNLLGFPVFTWPLFTCPWDLLCTCQEEWSGWRFSLKSGSSALEALAKLITFNPLMCGGDTGISTVHLKQGDMMTNTINVVKSVAQATLRMWNA